MLTRELFHQKFGTPIAMDVVTGMKDTEYHKLHNYFSSSSLKEYLHDPRATFAYRVRGQGKKAVHSDVTKANFRKGRAVHCFVMEGEPMYKSRFPIFGGDRKVGKAWEEFKLANAEAFRDDDILSKKEHETVMEISKEAKKQLDHWLKIRMAQEVLELYLAEASFFITYSSGISFRIRCDGFLLWKREGKYKAQILDLKTIESSPTAEGKLAKTIDFTDYDLQAALYTEVLFDCLNVPGLSQKVYEKLNVAPPTQMTDCEFSFFWVSKTRGQTNMQYVLDTGMPDEEVSWGHLGRLKVIQALENYAVETRMFANFAQNNLPELDTQYPFMGGDDAGRPQFYAIKNYLEKGILDYNLNGILMEGSLEKHFEEAFKRPIKKAPPPPPKKVNEAPKAKWVFSLGQKKVPSVPVTTKETPPPVHTSNTPGQYGVVPSSPAEVEANFATMTRRKQVFAHMKKLGWTDEKIQAHDVKRLGDFKKKILKTLMEEQQ